jgi:hypothetical protein
MGRPLLAFWLIWSSSGGEPPRDVGSSRGRLLIVHDGAELLKSTIYWNILLDPSLIDATINARTDELRTGR